MIRSRHAVLLERLERLAADVIEGLDLELVELTLRGSSKKRVLRLDIDRVGPGGLRLEDCQLASGHLGKVLEEEDMIQGAYVLEVSSPGIDRPIRTDDDIRRNTGRRIRVDTTEPVDGREQFVGVLLGGEANWLELRADDDTVLRIPRDRIHVACQEAGF